VARDLEIAIYEGDPVHIAHISCARTLGYIKTARAAGARVTCEVTPHHLTLTDAEVSSLNTNFKVNPPLRSESDRLALVEALAAGEIDCIATDHAPHASQEKEAPFEEAPFGVVGLETAFPVLYTKLVETGMVSLKRLVSALSAGPARALGLPLPAIAKGEEANFCLVDVEEKYDINADSFLGKSGNTPFAGWRVKGRVLLTLAGGRVAYRASKKL
jgi:dihydroorotase